MKKLLLFVLTLTLCLSFTFTALASGTEKETTQDMSQPRLMVTEYKVEGGSISPSKNKKLTVTFKNYSQSKVLKNIKLSLLDEGGEIETVGMPTKYVPVIYAGSTYVWELTIKASKIAQIGEHKLTVSSEYEDKYYNAYSGSDVISVNVIQSVGIDYSGVQLPAKLFAKDTATMEITILNTGKSNVRNLKVDTDIKNLNSGGTTFVGEIAAGEQGTASINLSVGTELGDIDGKVIITYEDEFGKKYKKEAAVSSVIIEKPVEPQTEEEKEAKYPLWWAFLLGGLVAGGGVGALIPISINNSKKRKEDELRL